MRSISRTASLKLGLPEDPGTLRYLSTVRWGLLVAALLLVFVGLLTIRSASAELSEDYLRRQAALVMVGLVAMLVTMAIDYHRLIRFSPFLYAVGLGLLLAVLGVGYEAAGARRWLEIGGFRLQPSEFAKLATVVLLARVLSGFNRRFLSVAQISGAVGIVALPMVLVLLERDLGGAVMFLPMLVGMLFVAGVRWQLLVAALLLCAVAAGIIWNFVMLDYQRTRVVSFLNPTSDPLGAGYQLRQSKIAAGSGQWTGRGYMQGTQSQLRFLPARHTDFVFAVLAEEWGFVGVATVLSLFAWYFLNGIQVAQRARDRAGILLVVGLLSGFAFHVIYNTAMVVGLVPVTGVPLPFVSYGGSFAIATLIGTGLILGVDFRRYVNR